MSVRDEFVSLWFGVRATICHGTLGRERTYPGDSGEVEVYKHRAREIIMGVVRRGVFKTRKPEGKAGGH